MNRLKFLLAAFVVAALTLGIYSCQKDDGNDIAINHDEKDGIEQRKVSVVETNILNKYLKDYAIAIKNISGLDEKKVSDIVAVKLSTSNNESIIAKINDQLYFSITKIENEFGSPILLTFDSNTNFSYTFLKSNTKFSVNMLTKEFNINYSLQTRGCGQATMDCMSDAYSNHGWISVYITVQTAFLPQTAAAIAGACAVKNCL